MPISTPVDIPVGIWTALNRGTADPIILENQGQDEILFVWDVAPPSNTVRDGHILSAERNNANNIREPSGFATGDEVYVRPVGDRPGRLMVTK